MAKSFFRKTQVPLSGGSEIWFRQNTLGNILNDEFYGLPNNSLRYSGPVLVNLGDGTTFNFTADIDDFAPDRLVLVCIVSSQSGTQPVFSSASVAGSPADLLAQQAGNEDLHTWLVAGPTASGKVSIQYTTTGTNFYTVAAVWALYGAIEAVDQQHFADPSFPFNASVTTNVAAGGAVFGLVTTFTNQAATFFGSTLPPTVSSIRTTVREENFLDRGQLSAGTFTLLSNSNEAYTASAISLGPAIGGTAGYINVWNGTSWVAKPVLYWNGTGWIIKPVKYYNGATWVTTP